MPLPDFNSQGDLPIGIHQATLSEIEIRFGAAQGQRSLLNERLKHIYDLARRSGKLQRFIIFGSYITAKAAPNDLDIILIMDDSFRLEDCPLNLRGLFDHAIAQARFGASLFWIRPALLVGLRLDEFIDNWQMKRDGSKRGIVEVIE